ncbi:hypothetical protein H8D30_02275 [bacterium]|nr:hypothetical protein [bacterium]
MFRGFLFLALVLSGCVPQDNPNRSATSPSRQTIGFLETHWKRPLSLQGELPAEWSDLERNLGPGACGSCHTSQMIDWAQSRHAIGMGPGLLGQYTNPSDAAKQGCLNCHAPLAEQALSLGGLDSTVSHKAGLTCAGCHMRNGILFGPPAIEGNLPEGTAHGGFTPQDAFQESAFCAACHQFKPGQWTLNGKFLENTYEEWKESPQGIAGESCQSCHMPDRRHLWRGIHDPEMVQGAVEVKVDLVESTGTVHAMIQVKNSGTGHHFPTYVTPRVILEACQVDGSGMVLEGTCSEAWFSREITMNLKTEKADTRIPAGEERVVNYRMPRQGETAGIRVRLVVDPDRFYRDMFTILLEQGRGVEALLKVAHKDASDAVFTAWEEVYLF